MSQLLCELTCYPNNDIYIVCFTTPIIIMMAFNFLEKFARKQ